MNNLQEMRNELLKHGNYNVIVVDWAGGSLPLYTQATANTRLVGLEIAHLIKHLQVIFLLKFYLALIAFSSPSIHLLSSLHSFSSDSVDYPSCKYLSTCRCTVLLKKQAFLHICLIFSNIYKLHFFFIPITSNFDFKSIITELSSLLNQMKKQLVHMILTFETE